MIGEGTKSTNQRHHNFVQEKVEVGFFTDPTVCIGCKACEVACKEWNHVPDDGYVWSGNSYDNTGHLGASTWRHVMFLEQDRQKGNQIVGSHSLADGDGEDPFRWVFLSDVCKHCEEAGCLEACPTGSIVLRLLRGVVPVWCDRSQTVAAARRGRRIQVHILLRSTKERTRSGLRKSLSDRIDRVWPTR